MISVPTNSLIVYKTNGRRGPRNGDSSCLRIPFPDEARPRPKFACFAKGVDPESRRCPLRTPEFRKRPLGREMDFTADPGLVQDEILQQEGAAEGNWLFMRALFVGDAELAKQVLVFQASAFRVSNPPHFKNILGEHNLGLLQEPDHGRVRGVIAPAFTRERVASFVPRIAHLAEDYVTAWAAAGRIERWDLEVKLFTFHVMADVIGGIVVPMAEMRQLSDDFVDINGGMAFPIPLELGGLTPFGKGMRARRRVEALLSDKFAEHRAATQGGSAVEGYAPSLLALMIDAADSSTGAPLLSEAELMDNFIGLLIAGHDTTASSLNAALYHLAANPGAMAQLRAEQRAVIAEHGEGFSLSALAEMPYTEGVLREAWRLHPVVPVVGREAARDVELGEYAVLEGQRTFVALNTVTRVKGAGWDDLEAFVPDRWMPGAPGAEEAAAVQFPFGAGPRSCVGAELAWAEAKILLATVARRLNFQVAAADAKWSSFPFPTVEMDCDASHFTGRA